MLIILNNLESHYEIEQLTRMFTKDLTVVHGTMEDNVSEETADYLYVSKEEKVNICLEMDGRSWCGETAADADTDKMYLDICAVIYNMYTEAFGRKMAWGMLTGVRPVRLMRNLYAKYKDVDEVCSLLQDRYFVSDEKIKLCRDIFLLQKNIIDSCSEKDYSLYISVRSVLQGAVTALLCR